MFSPELFMTFRMLESAHNDASITATAADEFTARVQAIDQAVLKAYLRAQREPCYESQLLGVAFPELDISHANTLTLYQSHFLLFHVLYRLQDEFYRERQYLFIHFMRTTLAAYPETGRCRFFEELLGRFCESACVPDAVYCAYHRAQIGDSALEDLSLRYFYLDRRNFYTLDERTATAFVNGTWEILTHYEDYRQSFKILDLPESADMPMIKKRFRKLAKQYHPDVGATSSERFHDINNAYQLLLRIHGQLIMKGAASLFMSGFLTVPMIS